MQNKGYLITPFNVVRNKGNMLNELQINLFALCAIEMEYQIVIAYFLILSQRQEGRRPVKRQPDWREF